MLSPIADVSHLRQAFLAETVATFGARHPDYSSLAGRIYAAYLHKQTPRSFRDYVDIVRTSKFSIFSPTLFAEPFSSSPESEISLDPALVHIVDQHAETINGAIIHARDFTFS